MRQQLTDPTLRLRRQAGEDVLQIGGGSVAVQACRLNQTHDRRSPLAGAQRAGKSQVFAADGNRPDLFSIQLLSMGTRPSVR